MIGLRGLCLLAVLAAAPVFAALAGDGQGGEGMPVPETSDDSFLEDGGSRIDIPGIREIGEEAIREKEAQREIERRREIGAIIDETNRNLETIFQQAQEKEMMQVAFLFTNPRMRAGFEGINAYNDLVRFIRRVVAISSSPNPQAAQAMALIDGAVTLIGHVPVFGTLLETNVKVIGSVFVGVVRIGHAAVRK